MTPPQPIALVTGATAGLGAEFTRQLATRGNKMVLVARNAERLQRMSDDVGGAETISADLTTEAGVQKVLDRIADPDRPITTLINNAGFANHDPFLRSTSQSEADAVNAMVRAVTLLCHAAAPRMAQLGTGTIINVSSVSAYLTSSTYSAAKAYVTSLSEALAEDLSGTGVKICAVLPGFTRTEFHERADLDMSNLPEWMWLDAGHVVRVALEDAARGRVISVPGMQYKAIVGLLRAMPRRVVRRISSGSHRPSWQE